MAYLVSSFPSRKVPPSAKAGRAEILAEKQKRSSLNEFVTTIREASEQLVTNLGRAAERVQSFKQVALDPDQPHRRNFDAAELAKQTLSHLGGELHERGLALRFRTEGDLAMDGDPGPFGQVLTHLAVNAMTHAFPDQRNGVIDVRMNGTEVDHVALIVTDNGCGMTPEIKRQAFDPFFTTRRHQGAAGLGLHTVYTIVMERLGGQLRLDSEARRRHARTSHPSAHSTAIGDAWSYGACLARKCGKVSLQRR